MPGLARVVGIFAIAVQILAESVLLPDGVSCRNNRLGVPCFVGLPSFRAKHPAPLLACHSGFHEHSSARLNLRFNHGVVGKFFPNSGHNFAVGRCRDVPSSLSLNMRSRRRPEDSSQENKKTAGPGGAAKKRMGEREHERVVIKFEEWAQFKEQLAQERVRDGSAWAGDEAQLKLMQERWNADRTSSASEDEDAMDVGDTNLPKWKTVRDRTSGDVYFWNVVRACVPPPPACLSPRCRLSRPP